MKTLLIAAALAVASIAPAQAQQYIGTETAEETKRRQVIACAEQIRFGREVKAISEAMDGLEHLIFSNQRMPAVYRHGVILDMVAEAKKTASHAEICSEDPTTLRMDQAALNRNERLLVHAAKALSL